MFDQTRDPSELATEHLEHEITQLAAHIYAATCRWLGLVAEFERRECHLAFGFHSTTAWLAWTCGLTARAAREHVRVARDLAELPLIRASFGRGEISYSKVRALTRAATPETEAEMLELAHNATAAQLERTVRAYRSAIAAASGQPPPDTYFAWAWEDDGTLSVRGRLSADQGALLVAAVNRGREVAYGKRGGRLPPTANRRCHRDLDRRARGDGRSVACLRRLEHRRRAPSGRPAPRRQRSPRARRGLNGVGARRRRGCSATPRSSRSPPTAASRSR